MSKVNYMDDCIHLHACRRVQSIGEEECNVRVPRNCSEHCNCYVSDNTDTGYISISKAVQYAIRGAQSIRDGYDEYDVYASCDLIGSSIGSILEELE